jgi:DNA-binding response OmpR family regulator
MISGDHERNKIVICAAGRDVFRSVSDALPGNKFITEYFSDADDFFRSHAGTRPDLILHGMCPGKTVYKSLNMFRENTLTWDVPLVVLLDDVSVDRTALFSSGARDYILLPASVDEISAKVNLHIAIRESGEKENALISTINSMADYLFVMDQTACLLSTTSLMLKKICSCRLSFSWAKTTGK